MKAYRLPHHRNSLRHHATSSWQRKQPCTSIHSTYRPRTTLKDGEQPEGCTVVSNITRSFRDCFPRARKMLLFPLDILPPVGCADLDTIAATAGLPGRIRKHPHFDSGGWFYKHQRMIDHAANRSTALLPATMRAMSLICAARRELWSGADLECVTQSVARLQVPRNRRFRTLVPVSACLEIPRAIFSYIPKLSP